MTKYKKVGETETGEGLYIQVDEDKKGRGCSTQLIGLATAVVILVTAIIGLVGSIPSGEDKKPLACSIEVGIIQGIFACNSTVIISDNDPPPTLITQTPPTFTAQPTYTWTPTPPRTFTSTHTSTPTSEPSTTHSATATHTATFSPTPTFFTCPGGKGISIVSKFPETPPEGCVLVVEWWVPPTPTSCGIIFSYEVPNLPSGAIGTWWHIHPNRVQSHTNEYLARPGIQSAQCSVEDLR